MSDLPTGWETVELGEHVYVAGRIGWRGLKRAEYTDTGPIFLAVKNILPNGEIDFRDVGHISIERYDESPEIQLTVGDILLTKDGTIGKVGMVSSLLTKTTVNSSILVVRPDQLMTERFLFFYLRSPSFQSIAFERITGSAIPHLFQKDIKKLSVAVPPLNEQNRIVEKLEKLFEKIEATQERLDKIPAILNRFRQSVLAAACSGRLTAKWRESSNETHLESHLPTGWQTGTVGSVISDLKYGTSLKSSYEAGGVPVLRIPNIRDWFINSSDLKFANLPPKEYAELKLQTGDVLLIRSNGSVSLIGKTAIVKESEKDFAYGGYLIRLRPDPAKIVPEFLNYLFGFNDVRLQIESPARSTSGVNNINSAEVRALTIPIPPLDEQNKIVRRIEQLFEFSKQIEQRYKEALIHTNKLPHSILAKAFRGELAPQDPNDEPVSALLARIEAAKLTVASTTKNKIRPKRKSMKLNHADVETAIHGMGAKPFSFDDLKEEVRTDYETLKNILFSLLDQTNPIVKQIFDKKSSSMKFMGVVK